MSNLNKLQQLKFIRALHYERGYNTILELSRLSEDHLQAAVCSFLEHKELLYFAIPNGSNKSKSLRALFKFTGLRRGMPDLMICKQSPFHSGLFIELKHDRNKSSTIQLGIMKQLQANNYCCHIAWKLEDVEMITKNYLDLCD